MEIGGQRVRRRHILPNIRVATLMMHRTGDRVTRVENGRHLADRIPGAQFVELPGDDRMPSFGDTRALLDTIEAFVARKSPAPTPVAADRVLATVLAIPGSYHELTRLRTLTQPHFGQFRSGAVHLIDVALVATFDGPARAIRCAAAVIAVAAGAGIEARAGLHTGEIEFRDDRATGVAIQIATEIAESGSVLVSSTVKDLVAGSGIRFDERGAQVLADLPDEWRVFAVDQTSIT